MTTIRAITAADEAAWRKLCAGYTAFYRARVPEETTAILFGKLVGGQGDVFGFVAEIDGRVVGLAHYLFHASGWNPAPNCYLEDLYADPEARGSGIARALLQAVEDAARAQGAFRLYWQTQEYNAPARSLYDPVVPRSSFIVYRKALP